MKICLATGTFPPDVGGPPTYLATLIEALRLHGHKIRVVTYGEARDEDSDYPVQRVSRDTPIPVRLAGFTRALLDASRGADLLFVSDYGLPPAVVNRLRRLPLVIKIVGDFAWEYSVRHRLIPAEESIEQFQARRNGLLVTLLKRLQRSYVSSADRVIVPSNYLSRLVEGWGVPPASIRIVYNAVPACPSPPTRSLNGRRVLTVARLAPWKGVDTLIRALAASRQDLPDAQLVVIGDGPDRGRLERMAEAEAPGAVRFLGELPRSAVHDQMHQASALALASKYEGLSHVLLEGMACGLPILASDVGGNPELVEHRVNGTLVPVDDVPAWTRAFNKVLDDPKLRRKLGRASRERAATMTVDEMVERTIEVFTEAIAVRRGAAA